MTCTTDEFYEMAEKMGYKNLEEQMEILNLAVNKNKDIFSAVKNGNNSDLLSQLEKANNDDEEDVEIDDFGSYNKTINMASSISEGKYIKEFENDNIFIPSSSYCGIKALNKYFELQGRGKDIITYKSVNANKLSKNDLIKHMLKYTIPCECATINRIKKCKSECYKSKNKLYKDDDENDNKKWFNDNCIFKSKDNSDINISAPEFCKIEIKDGRVIIKKINKKNKFNKDTMCIGIVRLVGYKDIHHAVLIKNRKNIKKSDFKIVRSSRYVLNPEVYNVNKYINKSYKSICCAYDIETYVSVEDDKLNLYPAAIGFKIFDIDTGYSFTEFEVIENINKLPDETTKNNYELFDMFFEKLSFYCNYISVKKINIYAHNGGRFDNIYATDIPNVKHKKIIYDGNKIKKLVLEKNNVTFVFLDSLPFTLDSLEGSCKTFKTTIHKQKFDIINKPKEWYSLNYNTEYHAKLKNHKNFKMLLDYRFNKIDAICKNSKKEDYSEFKDWVTYLKYDVESLADLLKNVQKMYKDFGFSITNYIGLPGIAWDIMHSYCFGLRLCTIPKDPTIIRFYREGYYGGRTIFFKNRWDSKVNKNDYLICIDMNSLYPSAMYIAGFPCGEPILIKDDDDWLNKKHFIVEVDIKIPNIRYAIHPVRINNTLVYPSNQIITGVYNDVDLREMLKDGYEVVKFHRGVYFNRSEKIFNQLIKMIYDKRAYYKSLGSDHEEYNKEYICKILLNSTYGKYNETIYHTNEYYESKKFFLKLKKLLKSESIKNLNIKNLTDTEVLEYAKKYLKNIRYTKLKNSDTYYITTRLENPIVKKPTYIAGYVTSYSRAIVNEIIRKVKAENIYASDTDSLYMPKSVLDKCNLNMTNKLCGFKNDYGDDVMITKAIFLDIKRAYLEFEKKTKVNPITYEKLSEEKTFKTFKFKFTGLNFKDVKSICSILRPEDKFSKLNVYNSEEEYYDLMKRCEQIAESLLVLNERNEKNILKVVISSLSKTKIGVEICDKDMSFVVSPEKRGQWINNEYYSLGYDLNLDEYISNTENNIGDLEKYFESYDDVVYKISSFKHLKSNRPLFYPSRFKYKYIKDKRKEIDLSEIENFLYSNRKNNSVNIEFRNKKKIVDTLLLSILKEEKFHTKNVYEMISYISNSCVMFDNTKTWVTDYYIKLNDAVVVDSGKVGYVYDEDISKVEIYYKDSDRYFNVNIINVKDEVKVDSKDLYPVYMLSDEFNKFFGNNNMKFNQTIGLYKSICNINNI